MKKILILPGDGIGPEVVSATVEALSTLTRNIEFVNAEAGLTSFRESGCALPKSTLSRISECDAILMGTIMDSDEKGYRNPESEIIRRLDLQTNVRRIKGVAPALGNFDTNALVISNNDNMNTVLEMDDFDGITKQIRLQYHTCERVFEDAIKVAKKYGMKKITCVHGNYIFGMADSKFVQMFYDAMEGQGFDATNESVADFIADIVSGDKEYEVIVTMEMYSKIVGDAISAKIGGSYLTSCMDYNDGMSLFKPCHGPNLQISNTDCANPTGSIMSAVMMLKHFGMDEESKILEEAIVSTYKRGYEPRDIGGKYGMYDFAEQIAKYCENRM